MANGRDENGRFAKGWKGGPGRPRRQTEERYLCALVASIKADDWKAIVMQAIAQAREGDRYARQWLADYLIGKPTEYVNTDVTSGGNPLAVALTWGDSNGNGNGNSDSKAIPTPEAA